MLVDPGDSVINEIRQPGPMPQAFFPSHGKWRGFEGRTKGIRHYYTPKGPCMMEMRYDGTTRTDRQSCQLAVSAPLPYLTR